MWADCFKPKFSVWADLILYAEVNCNNNNDNIFFKSMMIITDNNNNNNHSNNILKKINKNYSIDRRIDLNLSKSVQSAAGLKLWSMLPMGATLCANQFLTIYISIYYLLSSLCNLFGFFTLKFIVWAWLVYIEIQCVHWFLYTSVVGLRNSIPKTLGSISWWSRVRDGVSIPPSQLLSRLVCAWPSSSCVLHAPTICAHVKDHISICRNRVGLTTGG